MDILHALLELVQAVGTLLWALARNILPWMPLIAWVAFWTFAVNWVKLRSFLLQGGWIGVMLIAVMAVLVWGVVAPPVDGTHTLLGLHVSNFVGKFVYVTALTVIMLLCGSMQLSGCCDRWLNLTVPVGQDHDAHGHDDHGHGHGHVEDSGHGHAPQLHATH